MEYKLTYLIAIVFAIIFLTTLGNIPNTIFSSICTQEYNVPLLKHNDEDDEDEDDDQVNKSKLNIEYDHEVKCESKDEEEVNEEESSEEEEEEEVSGEDDDDDEEEECEFKEDESEFNYMDEDNEYNPVPDNMKLFSMEGGAESMDEDDFEQKINEIINKALPSVEEKRKALKDVASRIVNFHLSKQEAESGVSAKPLGPDEKKQAVKNVYKFLQGKTSPDGENSKNNIRTIRAQNGKKLDLKTIMNQCNANSKCRGFVYDETWASLKSKISPTDFTRFKDKPNSGVYIKNDYEEEEPSEQEVKSTSVSDLSFKFHQGRGSSHKALKTLKVPEGKSLPVGRVIAECKKYAECIGFVYGGTWATLKKGAGRLVQQDRFKDKKDFGFFQKVTDTSTQQPVTSPKEKQKPTDTKVTFKFNEGQGTTHKTIKVIKASTGNTLTVKQGMDECSKDPSCVGFVYGGQWIALKKGTGKIQPNKVFAGKKDLGYFEKVSGQTSTPEPKPSVSADTFKFTEGKGTTHKVLKVIKDPNGKPLPVSKGKEECLKDNNCVGFVYGGPWIALKRGGGKLVENKAFGGKKGLGFYEKQ